MKKEEMKKRRREEEKTRREEEEAIREIRVGARHVPPRILWISFSDIFSFLQSTLVVFGFYISFPVQVPCKYPLHDASQAPKYPTSGGHLRGPRNLHRRPAPAQADRLRPGLHTLALLGRYTLQRPRQSTR